MAGLLVTGSLLILTGCGGSSNSSLSYSAFSNSANKICTQLNNDTKQAGGGVSNKANAASAAAIQKILTASNGSIAKLKALNGPSALNTAMTTFVGKVESSSVFAKQAITAAKAGNQSAYVAAAKKLGAANDPTDTAASKLGAPACAAD
jgi:hypothetical protein